MIPEEAVQRAAKALALVAYDDWAAVPGAVQRFMLRDAKISLEAAAPHIRARALEDAATELARLPYVKPGAEGRDEYEALLLIRRGDTDAWLKARAVTERGGE